MSAATPDFCVVDIWGGELSHVARFFRPIDEALQLARSELARGYLVNLWAVYPEWGPEHEFDNRERPN